MTDRKKRRAAFLIVLLLILTIPVSAEAASRGVYYRPALTFVARNAPSDMILRMDFQRNGEAIPVYLHREDRLWESYFRFYRQTAQDVRPLYGNRADFRDVTLYVITGGQRIQVPLPEDSLEKMTMDDFFMLDTSDYSLRFGLPLGRAVLLFFLRLAITLSAALLVLYLFQYRWRKSWLVVLITNLVCQGGLSLFVSNWINFNPKLIAVHIMVMLAVLIIQIPLFWWLLDENGSYESVSYAVWSNVATGILNSIILINFPL
jgi:hypothetical protein